MDYIKTIDGLGGALAGIEQGFQQREIQEAAYRFQRQVEENERVIVGVNDFVVQDPEPTGLLRVDPTIGDRQRKRLAALRAGRDGVTAARLVEKLQHTAEGTGNLVPVMVECVENKVTLGEISHCLRRVWGEQRETVVI
jgi:methylmalonyl-CoA mutase N-terminal domain/subunit